MRVATVTGQAAYKFFGFYAGIGFWDGGLTLLAASPGVGKTSVLLRMVFDAAADGVPSAIACYEHTEEEMKYRLRLQALARTAGAHGNASDNAVEMELARGGMAGLASLDYSQDTVRAIENIMLSDFGFPEFGPALLAIDYLNLIPVVGLTGFVPVETRSGEAAAALRRLANCRHWAIIAAAALKTESFSKERAGLEDLFGDERVPYEADRVFYLSRSSSLNCGCFRIRAAALKDRTGPTRNWEMEFWGERFFPATSEEFKSEHA